MDIKLGTDGDIEFTNNDLQLVDDIDAIKQHLSIRLQTFLGEVFFDSTRGVPWFTDILIKNPSFLVVGEILKSQILDTDNVTDIISFNFDLEGREATLETEILTTNGFIDFSQKVGI